MKYLRLLIITLLFGFVTQSQAQTQRLSNSISVKDASGYELNYAWVGGMNNPQFSSIDINQDGKLDMIVFNRDGKDFTPYLNMGETGETKYKYAPSFVANFDSCDCKEWALFRDYNCDGRIDLYCGRGAGQNFRVYENVLYAGDSVGFEMRYDQIYTEGSSGQTPLYVTRTDIPAIADIDDDGDLDIISTPNGSNRFSLHRNRAIEDYGTCDTLVYVKETSCWGHIAESASDNTLFLPDTVSFGCKREGEDDPPIGGSSPRHVGTTLLTLDTNDDKLIELLLGDVSSPRANLAINHGELDYAFMDEAENSYPHADSAIYVDQFPAFYHVDVNNDDVRDLIVAPNARTSYENVEGVVLYENMGTETLVDFKFQGRGFMSKDQIDIGQYATPTLFDHNDDGLMDMLVGGATANYLIGDSLHKKYELRLYENTGTEKLPAFTLIDKNYLGINEEFPQLLNVAVTAGDLDGDGDDDLLLGQQLGTIYYYQNVSLLGSPASYVKVAGNYLRDVTGDSIDVGVLSAPELFDIDSDGDLDLFVGDQYGRLTYFENIGSSTAPQFQFVTSEWGFVKVYNELQSTFSGTTKPLFIDYDGDNEPELLVGEESGFVAIFDNLDLALTDTLVREGNLFDFDFGNFAAPVGAKLDSTGKINYIVGTARGGLMLFNTLTKVDSMPDEPTPINPEIIEEEILIFPNPTEGFVFIQFKGGDQTGLRREIRLMTPLGQTLKIEETTAENIRLDLSTYARGIYLITVRSGNNFWTSKILRE